jgi:hypothetical protein
MGSSELLDDTVNGGWMTEYWRVGDIKKRFCTTDAEEPKIESKPAKKKDTRKSPQEERKSSVWKNHPFISEKSVYERKRNRLEASRSSLYS